MSTSGPPADSPWHLDDTTSASITLPDGRTLGYAEYGVPDGTPIFYMPGFPSSRIEGAGLDPEGTKLGLRIISIDRPRYGLSSPHKDRTVRSCAEDVGVLADHLALERYGVLGISGGGPYALACALVLPADKLRAVTIVCGLGSPDMGYKGMCLMSWLGWTYGQRLFPRLCRWWFSHEPAARLDLSEEERVALMRKAFEKEKPKLHAKDAATLGREDFLWFRVRIGNEVFKHGMEGFGDDFRVLNSDFGFKIEDIRKDLPVALWHGNEDVYVPLQHAEKVKARLGDHAQLTVTDDTHASIWNEKKEEFLAGLAKAVRT